MGSQCPSVQSSNPRWSMPAPCPCLALRRRPPASSSRHRPRPRLRRRLLRCQSLLVASVPAFFSFACQPFLFPRPLVYSSRVPAALPRALLSQVSAIVVQIAKFGNVTRPVVGISFAPEQSVEQLGVSGVLVLDAPPNGPAGKGIRPTRREFCGRLVLGDVITSVNEKKIFNDSDLYKILDRCEAGDTVKLGVPRGDRKVGVDVTVAPRD